MTTTLTTDLLAHVAAVRDGACDDTDLLVLADKLDEAANSQPAEYDQCKKCYGAGEVRGWLVDSPCPVCGGNSTIPRPNQLRDRAELIRVQVELENGDWSNPYCRVCGWAYDQCSCAKPTSRYVILARRERDLLARNPAWLSASDPPGGIPAAITRGFLDITLPHTLCWEEEEWWYFVGYQQKTVPHPVLRAVLASPAGPWVRRVRVEGVEPTLDEGGWEWYGLPDPLCTPETKDTFTTAEAATDALSLVVPRWARGAK